MTDDDDLLPISRFAHLSGLSQHALRHYDEVGLLRPAVVDPGSRYRRYRREQVGRARLIKSLRWLDLPIEQVRVVLADPDGAASAAVLAGYRERLVRDRGLTQARIDDIDRMLRNRVTMSTTREPITGCRPAQIKLAVDDRDAAVAFYEAAFDLKHDVVRRTEDEDHGAFMFGDYGSAGFFLIHLADDTDLDRPGGTTFGLLVDDLDARHAAALAAGGVEAVAPDSPEGMPRCSAVKDPSGNWVWLYQG